MKFSGVEINLKNYLDLLYVGDPPTSRGEIEEDDIPEQLRGQLDDYFDGKKPRPPEEPDARAPDNRPGPRFTPVDHDPFSEEPR